MQRRFTDLPLAGFLLKAAGFVGTDSRNSATVALKLLRELCEGRSVVLTATPFVSPSTDPTLMRCDGALWLARRAKRPLILFGIDGASGVIPFNRRIPSVRVFWDRPRISVLLREVRNVHTLTGEELAVHLARVVRG